MISLILSVKNENKLFRIIYHYLQLLSTNLISVNLMEEMWKTKRLAESAVIDILNLSNQLLYAIKSQARRRTGFHVFMIALGELLRRAVIRTMSTSRAGEYLQSYIFNWLDMDIGNYRTPKARRNYRNLVFLFLFFLFLFFSKED